MILNFCCSVLKTNFLLLNFINKFLLLNFVNKFPVAQIFKQNFLLNFWRRIFCCSVLYTNFCCSIFEASPVAQFCKQIFCCSVFKRLNFHFKRLKNFSITFFVSFFVQFFSPLPSHHFHNQTANIFIPIFFIVFSLHSFSLQCHRHLAIFTFLKRSFSLSLLSSKRLQFEKKKDRKKLHEKNRFFYNSRMKLENLFDHFFFDFKFLFFFICN